MEPCVTAATRSPPCHGHRWARVFLLSVLAMVAVPAALALDDVILAEFLADDSPTYTDDNRTPSDWIELRNVGSTPVNLSGWALTDRPRASQPWRFPATNLPAGGHLLVWASGKDRRIAGAPLHTDFRLGTGGEYLALRRPDDSVATAFAPAYPPQLPQTSFGFLPGATQAVFFTAPTPGAPNESTKHRPGPYLDRVTHHPLQPQAGEPITVTARVIPVSGPATEVVLFWRSMFQREVKLAMTAQANGNWTATLPARAAGPGQLLRWRVTARDAAGGTTAFPLHPVKELTSQWLGLVVQPEDIASRLPVFRLFLPPNAEPAADSEEGTRAGLFYDGEYYDNVFIKVRGNTTAYFPKKSHRLEFPADHPFRHPGPGKRIRDTSLMAEWGDPTYLRQHLSFWLQEQTGSAAPFHYPVRLELNGKFWQLAMHSQVLGGELLARHGLDPDGALYKAVGTLTPDFNSTGGFEKKTRRQEGPADYLALAKALGDHQPLPLRSRALFERMNLPAVINYLAVARLTQEDDDIWANMSLYHDNDGTDEWRPVPFDMNVSWGFSFAHQGIVATQDRFRSHPFFGAADVGSNQGHNALYDAVVQVPETREMLLRRMRTLLDRWWQPPGTPLAERVLETHIAQMTHLIAADAILDRAAWGNPWTASGDHRPADALSAGVRDLVEKFIEPRRRHFYVTHQATNATNRRPLGITSAHTAGIPAAQPVDVQVRFDAVQIAPGEDRRLDVLSLTNGSPLAVDVSGWSLEGRVRFTFAPGTVIPKGGRLLISPNVRAYRAGQTRNPAGRGAFVVGAYRGSLATPGPLRLKNERGALVAESTTGSSN